MLRKILLFIACVGVLTTYAGAAEKTVDLSIVIDQPQFRDIYQSYFDQFVAQYKKNTGTTVKISFETPSVNNSGQILQSRFAANDAPDIFFIHPINNGTRYDNAGYLEDLSSQPFTKNLYNNVKKIISYKGKIKSLPLESVWWGYVYNKEIFDKVGIKPAMTLTEMKTNVKKLKDAGYQPFLLSYNEAWVPQLFISLIVGSLNETKNKGFVDKMNQGKGSFAELKEFFDIIDLVNANGNANAMDLNPSAGASEFAKGKIAMWVQGPWMAEEILKSNPNCKISVAPLPINDDPKCTMINIAVSKGLSVYSKSKNKEVAFALLNYMLDEKKSNGLYQALKFNPVSSVHTFPNYPWVESALAYVKKGQGYQDPIMPGAVKDEVGRQLQLYFLKKISKEDFIKKMDNSWRNAAKGQK